jgi:glycine cleavage system aminomethyltransferase T|tara:strand:- start:458 stop:1162 length:705 start_codon:yes stop_codon:yes gene_type:complete
VKKQPLKNSALNFSLIENGAAMIEYDGWNIATNFGNIEEELNAAKTSVAISDISNLIKHKIYMPKLNDFLARNGDDLRIGEVRKDYPVDHSDNSGQKTTRLSIDELWISSKMTRSPDEIKAPYRNSDGAVELFELTSAFTGIRLLGPQAPLLLSELTDLNIGLNALKNLTAAQSMFLQVHGLLIRDDLINIPTYDLFVDRSYGIYAWQAIMNLGARHNAKLVGTECISQLESNI